MGVALRAIAKDGDLLVLDEVDVAVTVIINAHGVSPDV
jgi:4-hydroxy-3-methylbut-2-enyl diphosphate reductase IspH